MKNKFILFVGMFLTIWSCGKEEQLNPELKPENVYMIQDDPSDSIQHKRYELYRDYGVGVFFNDTIGKVFVKVDIHGDSIFQYERIEPEWRYTGYDNLEFNYTYMTTPEEQSKYLNMVEELLQGCSKTLYPYSIFVVNDYNTVNGSGKIESYTNGNFKVYYRVLIVTGTGRTDLKEKPGEIIRSIIESRITDYIDLMSAFNRVSKEYLGTRDWGSLGIGVLSIPVTYEKENPQTGEMEPVTVTKFSEFPYQYSIACLDDDWFNITRFTPEEVERFRHSIRAEISKFGFVGKSVKSRYENVPPRDAEDDLQAFVKEVMRLPQEEFRKTWGDFPLVMQKYEIVSNILINDLGVKL